ncbi:MAG: hypothetical protein HOQ30_18695 [Gemmatimonadaceae bacterium]|nr:hypothetical protein [Gemmatimonadaceae bacterium]
MLTGLTAPVARAQASDTTARGGALSCPASGVMARPWSRPGTADSTTRQPLATPATGARSGAIDTVITLDIRDRTWQRDNFTAGVALGVAGTAGTRGAPWHACAGATAAFGRITATLHNVHGQIHLKADPSVLDSIGRTTRGITPPAPPRR